MIFRVSTALKENLVKIRNFETSQNPIWTHFKGSFYFSYNIFTSAFRMITIFLPMYSHESGQCFKYPEHAYPMFFRASIALWKQNPKENLVKIRNFETSQNLIWTHFKGSFYFSCDIFTSTCRMVTIFFYQRIALSLDNVLDTQNMVTRWFFELL